MLSGLSYSYAHLQAATLVTRAIALLVGPLVVKCLLNTVAPVKQHVSPSAKQVKIPVLLLAVGVTSQITSDIALDKAWLS